LASQLTLSRFTALMAEPANPSVLREAVQELAGRGIRAERGGPGGCRPSPSNVDSAPIEGESARATGSSVAANGHQPEAEWNGHTNARIYHPLITRVAETGDMLDARLRAGNVGTAPSRQIASQSVGRQVNACIHLTAPARCPAAYVYMCERGAMDGALDVILDVVDRAQKSFCDVAMVRIDRGFPSAALLAGLEARDIDYVSRLKANRVLDNRVLANPVLDRLAEPHMVRPVGRRPATPRTWLRELRYRAESWQAQSWQAESRDKPRRVVLVVKERADDAARDRFFLVTSLNGTRKLRHVPAPNLPAKGAANAASSCPSMLFLAP